MIILLITLSLTLLTLILILLYSMISTVVPMPSSRKERKTVLQLLEDYSEDPRLKGCKTIVELGSGWGGAARSLSRTYPSRNIEAIELSLIPYIYSRYISIISGYTNISYSRNNFLKRELKNREIYVCYLSGAVMKKLRRRFETDHPKDCLLISIAFAMPGWTPVRVEYAGSKLYAPVYVYEI
ncbi:MULTISPECIES: hypothetical protein [unclassified Oceanispirochaeta]|uniref:hypothetical protein n=1 Tax=unclassified Oceanispirochaeta TaxID=2635722 RepID=UPI0011C0669A|nr:MULTISPECIES: hypothetical protein [unclassified Oceanispirochaeta]MBF9015028.1 hypothetical protein [Oceanispirochaeta sp. M2]NPD71486.1 hypothetical protein [Oceanispirochaeta sp. M1]